MKLKTIIMRQDLPHIYEVNSHKYEIETNNNENYYYYYILSDYQKNLNHNSEKPSHYYSNGNGLP